MAKKVFGLASVKIGDIESDGGMGTKLNTIGETVSGTATMTQDDNTVTDFTIEESDSPVESIVTAAGKVAFNWSSYKVDYATLYKLLGGTGNLPKPVGAVLTLGTLTGGSSYTNGYYEDVPLSVNTGSGSGARANITVSGGAVTGLVITDFTNFGSGYAAAQELTAAAALIGGTGSGWKVVIGTVVSSAELEKWEAPDSFPDVEKSIQLTDKKGNVVKIPRAKISTKLGLSFAKDKLGQLDMVATVLQPTKSGEKRMTISFAS
jgi:hypothetical protein